MRRRTFVFTALGALLGAASTTETKDTPRRKTPSARDEAPSPIKSAVAGAVIGIAADAMLAGEHQIDTRRSVEATQQAWQDQIDQEHKQRELNDRNWRGD